MRPLAFDCCVPGTAHILRVSLSFRIIEVKTSPKPNQMGAGRSEARSQTNVRVNAVNRNNEKREKADDKKRKRRKKGAGG